jgi:hypothetical protein
MTLLEPFAEDFWLAAGPAVVSAGFRYPTRSAVIRLSDGGLFIWSPIALTEALRAEVDVLGEVRFLVTPTQMHHLSLTAWQRAYPKAVLYAAPRSRQRRLEIVFDDDLNDAPPPGWVGQIDQVIMRGSAIAEEVVFFHRKSGVALFADLLQNFPKGWFRGWQALVAQLDGMVADEPRMPQKFRLAFTNRAAARASLARVLAWPVERVVMAHGEPIRSDGAAFLKRAFRWL